MSHHAEAARSLTMSELTTMRVGGPVERVLEARDANTLVQLAQQLWSEGEDWLLLGSGSNTVVCDEGYPGSILLVRTEGIEVIPEGSPEGTVRLRVQAGHDWDALVAVCVERGWSGLEALSGIPGLVGAAPVQNIGAYGQEISDSLHSITFLDRNLGEVRRVTAAELELGYRTSAIKQGLEGVVLSIDLQLTTNDETTNPLSAPIGYGQLADALGVTVGQRVSIRELRRTVLRLRASKGMVLDGSDPDTWSAGSFFTNPIVTEKFARTLPGKAPRFPIAGPPAAPAVTTLDELAAGVPLRVPQAESPHLVKLSAAWLIENSGLSRGFRLPGSGAAISSKHTLALTNQGGATAEDVAQLARLVLQRVQSEFGVVLVPEPNLYGLEL
jgi:UDP-N-acetylmuramate dehydrogenase